MPFGILSLCTDGYPQTRDDYVEKMHNTGIYIRAAQYQTFLDLFEADGELGWLREAEVPAPSILDQVSGPGVVGLMIEFIDGAEPVRSLAPAALAEAVRRLAPDVDLQIVPEARRALEEDEVPVGAVVVFEERVIGRGHNLTNSLHDATAHAEMIAITQAAASLESWRLLDCALYVTLEIFTSCTPCARSTRPV